MRVLAARALAERPTASTEYKWASNPSAPNPQPELMPILSSRDSAFRKRLSDA
jgi:hypothetical protein